MKNASLLSALCEERVAVGEFVELLQQEQELLLENSIDPLLLLAEKKSAQAARLNELTESARGQLARQAGSSDNEAIIAWLKNNDTECLAAWQDVVTLAEQSRQLNHINGELIQMRMRHNQQSITALTRAVSQANLYGPDGQTNFTVGSGRSLGNV